MAAIKRKPYPESLSPEQKQKVRELQLKVNQIYENYDASDAPGVEPFIEFNQDSIRKRTKLLIAFDKDAKEKGLAHVIQLALHQVSSKKISPGLVQSAFAIFLTHNKEAKQLCLVVPPLALFKKYQRIRKPLANPVTPETLKGADIIAYFREDYDLNDHHHHWHLVYPTSGICDGQEGVKRTIQRQGELFFYMHTQMLARYDAELLAWGLDTVHPFAYDDVPTTQYIPPPGIQHDKSTRPGFRGWFTNYNPVIPSDSRPAPKQDLIQWKNNIYTAIKEGIFHTAGGGEYVVDESNMMNTVGVAIEALSDELQEVEEDVFLDRDLYGNLHNQGHMKFAEIGWTSQHPYYGVMSDTETAVRDPIFWIWHKHIDNIREEIVRMYDHSLQAYKPEAEIVQVELVPQNPSSTTPSGGIATYLYPPNLRRNEVHSKLRHEPYQWRVTVKSTRHNVPGPLDPQNFTVRLFIAPRVLIQDQRSWIEMDKFTYELKQEEKVIIRKDIDSSVARKVNQLGSDSRCSCGWPQNLMLPAGKPEGMPYVIFAMLTDDALEEDIYTDSISFCGASDDDYPDPRGMGYPFDKMWTEKINTTQSVESIIEFQPHIKLGYFTIYRSVRPYEEEGETDESDIVAAFNSWMKVLREN